MNCIEMMDAFNSIQGWKVVTDFSVGGFEWLSFSKKDPSKMLIISSQKITVIDCSTGVLEECDADYDEEALIAYSDSLPDEELSLAGLYGGQLGQETESARVEVITSENHITKAFFYSEGKQTLIFDNYSFYTCGFSYDGNYFVLADDGGINILKRVSR